VTTVYVTHDQEEAMSIADRLVIMNEGRIEQTGTPKEIYEGPTNEFIAGFLGDPAINLLNLSDGWVRELVNDVPQEAERVGIRPENLHVEGETSTVEAVDPSEPVSLTVDLIEPLGDTYEISLVDDSGEFITVLSREGRRISPGETVEIVADKRKMYLFDETGRRSNDRNHWSTVSVAGRTEGRLMADLRINDLFKRYDDAQGTEVAVDHIDLEITDGERLVLVGPSGCGRRRRFAASRASNRRLMGRSRLGTARVQDLTPNNRDIAMVFQSYALYKKMTARANIGYGLKHSSTLPASEREERVEEMAKMLGISGFVERQAGRDERWTTATRRARASYYS